MRQQEQQRKNFKTPWHRFQFFGHLEAI